MRRYVDNIQRSLGVSYLITFIGMYSQQAWGGPVDPFILIKFTDVGKDEPGDPIVSLLVFEWKDDQFVGIQENPDSPKASRRLFFTRHILSSLLTRRRDKDFATQTQSGKAIAMIPTLANSSWPLMRPRSPTT
jgi:hypothetical protein